MRSSRSPNFLFGAGQRAQNTALLLTLTLFVLLFLILFVFAQPVHGQASYNVIYRFSGGAGGQNPMSTLTMDKAGNLYGTTAGDQNGGTNSVFKLSPRGAGWIMTPLDTAPGGYPQQIAIGLNGTLYAPAEWGSFGNCGTIFNDAPPAHVIGSAMPRWLHKVLYGFDCGGITAHGPVGGLIFDQAGNMYGVSHDGGGGCPALAASGCGTVYQLSLVNGLWTETILHAFAAGDDGAFPYSGVIADAAGNLYGTTSQGGGSPACPLGCGTVYKLTHSGSGWTETILFRFQGAGDGMYPTAALILDSHGNLYGATSPASGGSTFRLSPAPQGWIYTSIGASGSSGNLVMDAQGNIFGASLYGARNNCGYVYELTDMGGWWSEQIMPFATPADGCQPYGGLSLAPSGKLYGTTMYGGNLACGIQGCGVVFEIIPGGTP